MLLTRASSQITIEIEEAGLKKIQITDNGHGIAHDEVELPCVVMRPVR